MSNLAMPEGVTLIESLAVGNQLGEGIIWDARQQCAFWTDILGKHFYRWNWNGEIVHYPCPERLCSFGLTSELNWFIAAFESGFAFFNPVDQQVQWLNKVEADLPYTRMNDGKVDRQGRFWAGSMIEDENIAVDTLAIEKQAKLYRLEDDGQPHVIFTGIAISNGLSWSPDSKTLYFADSAKQCVWRSDFNVSSAEPSTRKILFNTDKTAFPDGSCIDKQGYLWNAQWGSACVRRYSPSGKLDITLPIECQQPSCVSFGGPNLNHLLVTSAADGLPSHNSELHKNNGAVFIYQTPFQGIAEPICTVPKRQQPLLSL
ncbi:SMP-30/gluconolactonase/LRE family protein [Paraglaciecola polaris]|uniref:SMP-30/gluconolactonase/LRE family protein n=1 Tax=Paraglaciecola polaris TaxID=222814 RepID=UPI0030EC5381|tara:strand:+ start:490 stop:1437 length:948 start_codon:yes stop_codon:yes gene_type:complete